ncbi:radical SAM protein [candidate division WOR-3 bacterium]|uniref:Radical SAM protein n=1 Tax=candidate division WOR-3 bacterium TaxID=2052148 RepID=A0A938BNR1_UNCW3|nr:radical SAM protein [candidate division WOR-3 bacterium]
MECRACPFECGIDRSTELGVCRATDRFEIALAQLHHWEEPPISGTRGSGTIFFSHCNLRCRFCQNYDISQQGQGREVTPARLLAIMQELEQQGAHNVNLVSPTHYSDQLLPILELARARLKVPVVWNSNGYEKVETLARLEGLVQVYLPDLKYYSDALGRMCSSAPDYFRFASSAIAEMKRQVGRNRYDGHGIVEKGLIIRHLVLPGHAEDSKLLLEWIHDDLGPRTSVSLMSQYYPVHRAGELPGMGRRISQEEYDDVRHRFDDLGFEEGFAQDHSSASRDYTPDFDGRGT